MTANQVDMSVKTQRSASGIRHLLKIRNSGIKGRDEIEIFFDLVGESDATAPLVLDGFVAGIIFFTMGAGRTLRIHGNLSSTAYRNLMEFQSAWSAWRPNRYRRVELEPDAVVAHRAESDRTISAFSGGVDSTFTAVRHKRKFLGRASYPLSAALMVHGFDVPLSREAEFTLLLTRVRPVLESLDLDPKIVRTNLRVAIPQAWEDSHGAQIAACLHLHAHAYANALIGSTNPYTDLVMPWGSNPTTDHLLSGGAMQMIHDGAAYSRTEKVQFLASESTAIGHLKVCWEGTEPDRNCGRCEKCVRTRLNLLAAGLAGNECFDAPLDLADIRRIPIRTTGQLNELISILEFAREHGVAGDWVAPLRRRVVRARLGRMLGQSTQLLRTAVRLRF